jgi:excisionase family DNA binding protein
MDKGGLRFLSPKEIQELLGCGRTLVYGLLASGEIHSHKAGKLRRVTDSDFERWLEDNKYPSAK